MGRYVAFLGHRHIRGGISVSSASIFLLRHLGKSRCFSKSTTRVGLRGTVLALPRGRHTIFGVGCFSSVGCRSVSRVFKASMNTLGTSCRRTIGGMRRFLAGSVWAFHIAVYRGGVGRE